ncbi:uncharacterized protein [Littorina saxatilis]|uniref:Lysine-specific metallo-endopeptidase domain-containing protein n=2 Tax=Littorina saxatilis TaxID=31220 RepID=A0AAN9G005_9CAEN
MLWFLSLLLVLLGCLGNDMRVNGAQSYRKGKATETHSCHYVRQVSDSMRSPEEMRPDGLNSTFYKKYTEAYGIPILGSNKVSDDALKRACYTVRYLFAGHSGVRNTFYKLGGRFAIMAETEVTLDVPEHSKMGSIWNTRARGLGGTLPTPLTTGAEENLLCTKTDRYPKEDIFLHEAAHAVDLIAARIAIPTFLKAKEDAFKNAKAKGLWDNTYAMTNSVEYFVSSF